jgi:hypothetical protein
VLESYGGWGKGTRTVLRKLVSAGIGFSGGGVLTEITHARRTVVVALVQGIRSNRSVLPHLLKRCGCMAIASGSNSCAKQCSTLVLYRNTRTAHSRHH